MPTPEPADLYEILQVHPAALPEVIQAAYLMLAQIHHPDRNPAPDAIARMAELSRAYGTLSDPQQRAAYDALRAGTSVGNSSTLAGDAVVHDIVRAKSFQLVDDAGRTRGELSLDFAGDPTLFMKDSNGQRRFLIEFAADGAPILQIYDQDGVERFEVYQSSEDGSQ